MSIIGLLIALLVILVLILGAKYILDACEVGGPIRSIVLLIVALLGILILLNQVGVVGPPMRVW